MKIFLHIGLHKTGTTFLQHYVFPRFDPELCSYNPSEIVTPIMHALILEDMGELTENDFAVLKRTIDASMESINTPILLLSNELMSQNMFMFNYLSRAYLLSRLFKGAEIILFLRFQTDWLRSVYKQSLQEGDVTSVRKFFNFDYNPSNNTEDVIMINPLRLDLVKLVESFKKFFGKNNVYTFFYEDLRANNKRCIEALCRTMSLPCPEIPMRSRSNKSYSALTCLLTLKLYEAADFFHLRRLLPSTRRFYQIMVELIRTHTFTSAPGLSTVKIDDDLLNWEAAKKKFFKRKLLIIFFKKAIRRIRLLNIWRYIMQNVLDRIVYVDWDILERAGIKERLNKYFYDQNKRLSEVLTPIDPPDKYLGKVLPVVKTKMDQK